MATTSRQEISNNIKRWPRTWSYWRFSLLFSTFICFGAPAPPNVELYLGVHSNITKLWMRITSGPQEGKHPCGCVVFLHS